MKLKQRFSSISISIFSCVNRPINIQDGWKRSEIWSDARSLPLHQDDIHTRGLPSKPCLHELWASTNEISLSECKLLLLVQSDGNSLSLYGVGNDARTLYKLLCAPSNMQHVSSSLWPWSQPPGTSISAQAGTCEAGPEFVLSHCSQHISLPIPHCSSYWHLCQKNKTDPPDEVSLAWLFKE